MTPRPSRLQEQLAGDGTGIEVRAVVAVADQPLDDGRDGLSALVEVPVIGLIVMLPILCLEAWRWARSGGGRRPRRYVMVVTNQGVGVAAPSWRGVGIGEWIVNPKSGERYELDYSLVATASDEVELRVAGRRYWAAGPNRDTAYRFFAGQ